MVRRRRRRTRGRWIPGKKARVPVEPERLTVMEALLPLMMFVGMARGFFGRGKRRKRDSRSRRR